MEPERPFGGSFRCLGPLAVVRLWLRARRLAAAPSAPTQRRGFSSRRLGFPKLRPHRSRRPGAGAKAQPRPGARARALRSQRKLEGLVFHRETLLARSTTCGAPAREGKGRRRLLLGSSPACSSSCERGRAASGTKALMTGAGERGGTAGAKQTQPAGSKAGSPKMLRGGGGGRHTKKLGLASGMASHHDPRIPEEATAFLFPQRSRRPLVPRPPERASWHPCSTHAVRQVCLPRPQG